MSMAAWVALAAVNIGAIGYLRQRNRPGSVPRAVSMLIAAVSLVDALFVAAISPVLAVICWAGFALTLALQRFVPGT
jgi:hypothetical protein